MERRYLQIDHRIPYEVADDSSLDEGGLDEFMLLDASSQRAKSWSCEHCRNWREHRDPEMCRTCFWAFPESHTHIAGQQVRRLDVEWRGGEVEDFDRLRAQAERQGIHIAILVKNQLKGRDA
jgi:hypothetical protein